MLTNSFRIIAGFFRLLFKDIVFAMLVKIYYGVFRLKKNDLTSKAINELARNQLVYFFIAALTAGFIIANLNNQGAAAAATTANLSKTVLAHLITSEINIPPDETLIEDTTPASGALAPSEPGYTDNSYILNKQKGLAEADSFEQNNLPIFNDNNDLIYKPLLTTAGSSPVGQPEPTQIAAQRTEITTYTVQDGDTISAISRRFNISINTILWANNLTAYSLIRPGDTLTILPYSGILYTVQSGDTVSELASKYGVDAGQILSYNNLSNGLLIGQKIILPGAQPTSQVVQVAANPTPSYTGISAIRDLIKTPPPARVSGSGLIWPTIGHYITQYFSWHHPAIDIANHIGTPIYAAASGVVLIAQGGWNGGYGNTILLDNGNNMKTRYGHASKLLVHPGDTVRRGQVIALMGSTGNSTGPHLHFEVIINNVHYNPLNYVR